MRISDWSSDVCSSDLRGKAAGADRHHAPEILRPRALDLGRGAELVEEVPETVDVGEARQVAECHRLVGEQRARHQRQRGILRSEEHTSELQSLMRISYAVFCLKKKKNTHRAKYEVRTYKTLQHESKQSNHKAAI